jgi:hypothetical protein
MCFVSLRGVLRALLYFSPLLFSFPRSLLRVYKLTLARSSEAEIREARNIILATTGTEPSSKKPEREKEKRKLLTHETHETIAAPTRRIIEKGREEKKYPDTRPKIPHPPQYMKIIVRMPMPTPIFKCPPLISPAIHPQRHI